MGVSDWFENYAMTETGGVVFADMLTFTCVLVAAAYLVDCAIDKAKAGWRR